MGWGITKPLSRCLSIPDEDSPFDISRRGAIFINARPIPYYYAFQFIHYTEAIREKASARRLLMTRTSFYRETLFYILGCLGI